MHSNPKRKQGAQSKFTENTDNRLRELVGKFGTEAWEIISRHMYNKSPKQCKDRWTNYLDPAIKRDPWEADEDQRLTALVDDIGPRWKDIATHFGTRTPSDVRFRYLKLMRNMKKFPNTFHNSSAQSPQQKEEEDTSEKDENLIFISSLDSRNQFSLTEPNFNFNFFEDQDNCFSDISFLFSSDAMSSSY